MRSDLVILSFFLDSKRIELAELYSIIDIETTGGTARSHKIIEIAIITFDGTRVLDTYATLINPGRYVPPFITSLTGISNEMLKDAPAFEEVAGTILQKTEGKIFVAHNVNFDYSFLKQEFNILGQGFDRKKLCTVRLAKKIMPGFRSYGLGTLTNALGISIENRHRALGDARATAEVLRILIENDIQDFIGFSLKKNSREATLPSNLPKQVFDDLPEKTGVYYFHNERGKVLYVGKARNIKQRILGHFTSGSGSSKRLFHERIHHISYELTGSELVALLLESKEIKRLWPEYNRVQKHASKNYGLFQYVDRSGYRRLSVSGIPAGVWPIINFKELQEARSFVYELVKKFKLCPKLCGLQKSAHACFDYKLGQCDGACAGSISTEVYNDRFETAMNSVSEDKMTFAIIGKGRAPEEKSLVLVENGIYLGHGYTDHDFPADRFNELKRRISFYPDDRDIQKILHLYMKKSTRDEIIYF
ncbi:MAG: GIY-YIG nuclease family protein [Cytophagales bacterium]|nr:GIY-YIG nuclease family protein [Cytophagales bacterium]